MDFRLRTATIADVSGIVGVHNSSWRTTYAGLLSDETLDTLLTPERRTAQWTRILTERQDSERVIVAEQDGGIVGFASCGRERQIIPDYEGELYAIYLLQSVQGQGIGTALFRQVVHVLREHGLTSMMLWVLKENQPARRFYEARGGRLITERAFTVVKDSIIEVAYGWPLLDLLD
jgi:ribosomal protein S18 acetylase RimI-like enzyme